MSCAVVQYSSAALHAGVTSSAGLWDDIHTVVMLSFIAFLSALM